jgi:uncharacterized membrane protein YccC
MAQALQALPFRRILTRFGAVSPELAFAIRYAVAVSAAIWIGHAPAIVTNQGTWILITVMIVAQPESGGSLLKGLLRAVGTLAAAIIAIVLFGLFSQDPPLMLASLFLVQAIGAYGFSGARYQYAWFVFAFTTAIVLGSAMSGTGAVETIAFQRATMVGLGLLIVFVTDMLLWPAHTEAGVRASLAARARSVGIALRAAIEPSAATQSEVPGAPASPLAGQLEQIAAARAEIGVTEARAEILQDTAILLEAAASRARSLRVAPSTEEVPTDSSSSLARAQLAFASQLEATLEEIAAALEAQRAPAPFAIDLEAACAQVESELAALRKQSATPAAVEGRIANLRDLVSLFQTLQRAFDAMVESKKKPRKELDAARIRSSLRADPFRMQIALRAGIAVAAALLIPASLGWSTNALVAPLAFMVAAIPTRGGVTQTLVALAVFIGLGWILADLAIVYISPVLGRMPLALVHVAAVAGTLAYVSAKKPKLGALRMIGGLVALLTVYGGPGAPTDVYGPYDTVCYFALGLAVGWASTHIFWPATAATLFRKRSAAQLELCLAALRGSAPGADAAERRTHTAETLQRFATQLTQISTLHGQAEQEAVEQALDGSRRAALVALTHDLFDASLARDAGFAASGDQGHHASHPDIAALSSALQHESEALLASVQSIIDALHDRAAPPNPTLANAHRAVIDCLESLRGRAEDAPRVGEHERAAFLGKLDARRQIITRQLALEAWLANWAAAEI